MHCVTCCLSACYRKSALNTLRAGQSQRSETDSIKGNWDSDIFHAAKV